MEFWLIVWTLDEDPLDQASRSYEAGAVAGLAFCGLVHMSPIYLGTFNELLNNQTCLRPCLGSQTAIQFFFFTIIADFKIYVMVIFNTTLPKSVIRRASEASLFAPASLSKASTSLRLRYSLAYDDHSR